MASSTALRTLRMMTTTPLLRAPIPALQFSIPSSSRLYATAPPSGQFSNITSSLRASAQAGGSPSKHTNRKPSSYSDPYIRDVISPPSAAPKSRAPLRELTEAEQLDDRWRTLRRVGNNIISLTLTTSRSIEVKGSDIATSYKRLSKILNENNIRRELKRQERFESGSDMRVRLNSERHRRRYKVAVGKAVSLAMRMKE